MLLHLSIQNFALIDHLELPFQPGMTVLTGETGAGKSILLDALGLVLGGRARGEAVRTGHDQASVSAQFCLEERALHRVDALLEDAGLPRCEDGMLLVRRLISAKGRHRQWVNGALATVSVLRSLTEPLVDFTGQHAQQLLIKPKSQLALLDAFADVDDTLDGMRSAMAKARGIVAKRKALDMDEREKAQRADWLRFQIDEIDEVAPELGEEEALLVERDRLAHVEKIQHAGQAARMLLSEDDGDALSRLSMASSQLAKLSDVDPTLGGLVDTLEEAFALVDDVARELSGHVDGLESNPARLDEVHSRLEALTRLQRKHGASVEAVLEARARMQAELDAIDHAEEAMAALDAELSAALRAAGVVATRLTAAREKAAGALTKKVMAELSDLSMPHATLEVAFVPHGGGDAALRAPDGRVLSASGAEQVELRFSANPGQALAPLAKVASGGELSRVLLAVKRVLLDRDPVPISVFDEVDTGVGGAVGEAIGDKLRAIAAGRQVLVVTHLPQIAALGHGHAKVEKRVAGGSTTTSVRALSGEDRLAEVARMLGGRDITDTTRAHASELLARTT